MSTLWLRARDITPRMLLLIDGRPHEVTAIETTSSRTTIQTGGGTVNAPMDAELPVRRADAHGIVARRDDHLICSCGAVLIAAGRTAQRRAWFQHSDEAREEEGDG